MKDRLPKYPGRVRIVPEDGSAAFYAVMTRADEPTEEGTALSKKNLLQDATAALFDLDENATLNDVFVWIAEYVAAAPKTETGSYVGTGTSGSGSPNVLQFEFAPKLVVISTQGVYPVRDGIGVLHVTDNNGFYQDNKNMPSPISVSLDGNRVTWYNSTSTSQMNESDSTYNYTAFG